MYAFTNHGDTESTERFFLPDRETAIGQEIAALWAGSSTPFASCQRLEPAKELSPQAEALFPGRRLPAREKTPSSVSSVPLW